MTFAYTAHIGGSCRMREVPQPCGCVQSHRSCPCSRGQELEPWPHLWPPKYDFEWLACKPTRGCGSKSNSYLCLRSTGSLPGFSCWLEAAVSSKHFRPTMKWPCCLPTFIFMLAPEEQSNLLCFRRSIHKVLALQFHPLSCLTWNIFLSGYLEIVKAVSKL